MTIKTTYGEVRQAYAALAAMARDDLRVRFGAALKWKRMLGVLRPLVEGLEELIGEVIKEHAVKDEAGEVVEGDRAGTVRIADVGAYNRAINEILKTPVEVGCDQVEAADFGDSDTLVRSSLAQHLDDLGPFFKEE